MENVITILGFKILPIYLQAATLLFTMAFGGGFTAYLWLKRRWETRGGRQFDHYLDTFNYASEPDVHNIRTLSIRNLGMTVRLETVIRGEKERGWMLVAAQHCDWKRRFVKDRDPSRQARILHVVRNASTRHWVEGETAHAVGLPTKAVRMYTALTAADATVGGVLMFRNMHATRELLEIVDKHPADKWRFEDDMGAPQDHSVRIETLRQMAEALLRDDGCRTMDDKPIRIISSYEARVPV